MYLIKFHERIKRCLPFANICIGSGDAFALHLDIILHVLKCQCKEVLLVLTTNRKEVLSFLTSYCKEVLVPSRIDGKKLQEVAGLQTQKEVLIIHTCYTCIDDENTQNRFKCRQKQSICTSSALTRNEAHLVSNENRLVPLETSLKRNETHLARWWKLCF